eukprot:TRINITY_DN10430_c0_g1_i1.p2 TRINITY_DN10430_c0_g1~~TRINITY_DN10430_c0_g1_i1.p2  ORF type:complete len:473 (-),score=-31.11 TRINITY_DN10430_c0_g1_i1:20-1438(-)
MKKIIYTLSIVCLLSSCTDNFEEATDFTSVENPNLSETSIVGQPNSARIWLKGLEREISLTLNEVLILAELGSDNYVNTNTFFNQFLDGLDIRPEDPDVNSTQYRIARLREAAQFGLENVGPADENYTAEQEAEYNFFEGVSYLFAGMYFSELPQEELGELVSADENLQAAINSFDKALALSNKAEYHLAKARAYYLLRDKVSARLEANQAIGISSTFTREAMYDQQNGPVNDMESALYARSTFDDLQPLPTLDFLDPKYSFLSADQDPSVHYLKAEEAYLILAEAAASDNDILEVQDLLSDLLVLVNSREVRNIDDTVEGRTEDDPGSRPDNSSVIVNGRSGLVLDRDTSVPVPSISGTSVTQSDIDALTDQNSALTLIYRMRQEIFIAEGIRFVDMGIKLVVSQVEFLQNPNVSEGDPATIAVIPSFINAVINDLDAFTYDASAGTATTTVNVTDILVANKTSEEVLPFN